MALGALSDALQVKIVKLGDGGALRFLDLDAVVPFLSRLFSSLFSLLVFELWCCIHFLLGRDPGPVFLIFTVSIVSLIVCFFGSLCLYPESQRAVREPSVYIFAHFKR